MEKHYKEQLFNKKELYKIVKNMKNFRKTF